MLDIIVMFRYLGANSSKSILAPTSNLHHGRNAISSASSPGRILSDRSASHLYRPSTTSIPERIDSSCRVGSFPARSVRSLLFKVTIWDTLATEGLGSPVMGGGRRTFPGARAHFTLLVNGTQTTVATRLRLNASPCTTATGRRNPGLDPWGAGKSAHQTSPRAMLTSDSAAAHGAPRRVQTRLAALGSPPEPC